MGGHAKVGTVSIRRGQTVLLESRQRLNRYLGSTSLCLQSPKGLIVGTATEGLFVLNGDAIHPVQSPTRRITKLCLWRGRLVVGGMDGAWVEASGGWDQLPTDCEETTARNSSWRWSARCRHRLGSSLRAGVDFAVYAGGCGRRLWRNKNSGTRRVVRRSCRRLRRLGWRTCDPCSRLPRERTRSHCA